MSTRQPFYSSRQARVSTGLAAMGALAIALWPWVPARFDVAKAVPFALTFLAWLFAEFTVSEPHPHDVELFNKLKAKLSTGERDKLRHHDMAVSFQHHSFDGSLDIADDWVGAKYQFVDPALQKIWSVLRERISEFAHYLAVHTYPSDFNPNMMTVKTGLDEQNGTFGEFAQKSAAELNRQAREITSLLDAFDTKAAARLRVHLL